MKFPQRATKTPLSVLEDSLQTGLLIYSKSKYGPAPLSNPLPASPVFHLHSSWRFLVISVFVVESAALEGI